MIAFSSIYLKIILKHFETFRFYMIFSVKYVIAKIKIIQFYNNTIKISVIVLDKIML